jgi:hypothetical protein
MRALMTAGIAASFRAALLDVAIVTPVTDRTPQY